MKLSIVAIVLAVIALVAGGLAFLKPVPAQQQPLGSSGGGNDFLAQVNFWQGQVNKTQIATTSQGTAITIGGAEFTGWANSGVVSFTPGLTAQTTLTFPASSTIGSLVPNAGDRETFCIRNATTTAGVYMTFAASTGVNLLTASTTLTTANGAKQILTGKVGCFTLTREAKTATTYDIDALLTVFQ